VAGQRTVDRPLALGHTSQDGGAPRPGLVVVWSGESALCEALPVGERALSLGRGDVGGLALDDACMSRSHAEVLYKNGRFIVRDLGSRNGTAVDGKVIAGSIELASSAVLRTGDTIALLVPDVRAHLGHAVEVHEGAVVGPILREHWDDIASLAQRSDTLHVTGETGAGKELAARAFHARGPRADGPFIAVNCATIPAAIAERLLFGAKRGAYSGADADSEGYVQAADGGTLFLDEIAELDAQVQAKLLRVLETREVLPLGATRAKPVVLRVVSATFGALADAVADKRFREDLYYRVARPAVALPPLRERREEIPVLAARALTSKRPAHVSLIERALTLPWRGNVRELLVELREADRLAERDGARHVEARHLAIDLPPTTSPSVRAAPREPLGKEAIEAGLGEHAGNVARTARALGVHRTQLRRWMEKHGLQASGVVPGEDDDEKDV
jgi:transcriptional regulator of acetoin/glycerol metabolism